MSDDTLENSGSEKTAAGKKAKATKTTADDKAATTLQEQKQTKKPPRRKDGTIMSKADFEALSPAEQIAAYQYLTRDTRAPIDRDLNSGAKHLRPHATDDSSVRVVPKVQTPDEQLTLSLRDTADVMKNILSEDTRVNHPASNVYMGIAKEIDAVSTELMEKVNAIQKFDAFNSEEKAIETTRIKVDALNRLAKIETLERNAEKLTNEYDSEFLKAALQFDGTEIPKDILHLELSMMPKGKGTNSRYNALHEIIQSKQYTRAAAYLLMSPQTLQITGQEHELLMTGARHQWNRDYHNVFENLKRVRTHIDVMKSSYVGQFNVTREDVKKLKHFDAARAKIQGVTNV